MLPELPEKLNSFLTSMSQHRQRTGKESSGETWPFITISRQTGAGGHSVASAILEEMHRRSGDPLYQGWQLFDQQLCRYVAQDPKLNRSIDELLTVEHRSWMEDFVAETILGEPGQDIILHRVFRIISMLCEVGKVVVLGRGGAILTRRNPRGIHLRLVAPVPVRVRRMVELEKLPEKEAQRRMRDLDRSRAAMVTSCFDRDINDPLLYDAVLNTDVVRPEEVGKLVADWVRIKAANVKANREHATDG